MTEPSRPELRPWMIWVLILIANGIAWWGLIEMAKP